MSESQTSSRPRISWNRRWQAGATLLALALVLIGSGWASQTDLVPEVVDFVRGWPFVGPERMAALETAYYDAQDAWTLFLYTHTHSPVVISEVQKIDLSTTAVLSPTATQLLPATPTATLTAPQATMPTAPSPLSAALPATSTTPSATPSVPAAPPTPPSAMPSPTPNAAGLTQPNPPAAIPPLILSEPQVGEGIWTSTQMPLSNVPRPPLWHTFYRPDPTRPYAQVGLMWMDLSQTQLQLVPGTVEPHAVDGTLGPGVIPPTVQASGKLLAAWNGGFLTISGAYGMMVDRHVVLPARDGLATLAQYSDGTTKIGVWGREMQLTPELVSFRQNGPILIDHGAVNENSLLYWGAAVSGATHIWRSGIGLTTDGALIYGAGNWLSAQTLGQALQRAGAVEAMQLDVNAWHVFFFTYTPTPHGLVATKLDRAMPGPASLYLTPYNRDFMYLVLNR